VVLAPGARPLRGRPEIDAAFARPGDTLPAVEVLAYAFHWEEVRVLGDTAIEWGRITGETRPRDAAPDTPPRREAHNVLRILRREAGGWKVHRTIWNDAPP
jgi:ketosteroid isomerase-like protein